MKSQLDSYIESIEHLPATPAVLIKLISLFRQPDRDVDEIVELMSRDPSLTTEVLRYSNSASFGYDDRIVDVFDAIMRVGFQNVYQIAVARFGMQALSLPQRTYAIDVAALWRHSAAAAATAGVIAKRVEESEALAFTAGLLHDVGKIVLASAEGARYGQLLADTGLSGSLLEEEEAKLIGFRHSEVGACLLDKWGLPKDISLPVGCHHCVEWVEPFERLCAVVVLADCMAHASETPAPEKPYASREAVAAMSLLQLQEDDMASLLQGAQEDIKRLTESLSSVA